MKKFTVNCNFGGQSAPFTVYIGAPESKHHPLHFQSDWLSKERGGSIPEEVMESLAKLKELSERNNVPFEELCAYALEAAAAPLPNEKTKTAYEITQQQEGGDKKDQK